MLDRLRCLFKWSTRAHAWLGSDTLSVKLTLSLPPGDAEQDLRKIAKGHDIPNYCAND